MESIDELVKAQENQRKPDIALNKREMSCIDMTHEKSIIAENDCGYESACPVYRKRAGKGIHKDCSKCAV
jgi:hypothetical protein